MVEVVRGVYYAYALANRNAQNLPCMYTLYVRPAIQNSDSTAHRNFLNGPVIAIITKNNAAENRKL